MRARFQEHSQRRSLKTESGADILLNIRQISWSYKLRIIDEKPDRLRIYGHLKRIKYLKPASADCRRESALRGSFDNAVEHPCRKALGRACGGFIDGIHRAADVIA